MPGPMPDTSPHPRPDDRLRRRLGDRLEGRPLLTAGLLCSATALVVGLTSADWDVQLGDTLYSIARQTGSSVDAIVAANPEIDNPDLIYVGQSFVIPDGKRADGNGGGKTSSSSKSTSNEKSTDVTTVRKGDTLESIAKRLGVSVDEMLRVNGYPRQALMVGRRVRAWAPPPPSGSTTPATHEVRTGETLEQIANRYGLTWPEVAKANDLANPNVITTGTKLTLPGRQQGFVCPVKGNNSFRNDFAVPKPGEDRFHEGVDIFAKRGTKVVAPVSGKVEQATGSRGGHQFTLYGDDGYRYLGSHMDEFGKAGRVEAGDVLGTVGNTGNAKRTAPHLHFQVSRDGISTNPHPTLQQAC